MLLVAVVVVVVVVVKEECIESWLLCEYEGSMAGHIRPLAFYRWIH